MVTLAAQPTSSFDQGGPWIGHGNPPVYANSEIQSPREHLDYSRRSSMANSFTAAPGPPTHPYLYHPPGEVIDPYFDTPDHNYQAQQQQQQQRMLNPGFGHGGVHMPQLPEHQHQHQQQQQQQQQQHYQHQHQQPYPPQHPQHPQHPQQHQQQYPPQQLPQQVPHQIQHQQIPQQHPPQQQAQPGIVFQQPQWNGPVTNQEPMQLQQHAMARVQTPIQSPTMPGTPAFAFGNGAVPVAEAQPNYIFAQQPQVGFPVPQPAPVHQTHPMNYPMNQSGPPFNSSIHNSFTSTPPAYTDSRSASFSGPSFPEQPSMPEPSYLVSAPMPDNSGPIPVGPPSAVPQNALFRAPTTVVKKRAAPKKTPNKVCKPSPKASSDALNKRAKACASSATTAKAREREKEREASSSPTATSAKATSTEPSTSPALADVGTKLEDTSIKSDGHSPAAASTSDANIETAGTPKSQGNMVGFESIAQFSLSQIFEKSKQDEEEKQLLARQVENLEKELENLRKENESLRQKGSHEIQE
ncbi:hypothetical protein DL546_006127 [Coniochaeta pulveracea]|uniref:Uncharacterized protein n=1 Tax=Coniochaeta pulveracea TaxID=177199 RepID=A0A420YCH6_9PEZI|nr:hypothetical protein DL546_006127 [Coniochaeta pulveracea]